MVRSTGRGKVAYSWISPDPVKAGPTMGGGGGVVPSPETEMKLLKVGS